MSDLLKGVRVLDLTRMLAGPYGSQLLADLGAEVIKIEPLDGDPMRRMGPHFVAGESAYFLSINRNKKSICLDLKAEAGRRVFLDLVTVADVVFENFRPGVMERLGLGFAELKEVKADIILCSISGYGREGPRRDQPAFDIVLQALSGAMSVTGDADGRPARMGLPMADLAGGMFGALAVTAALHRRNQNGEGAHLDISLLDGQVSLLTYMAQYYLVGGEVPRRWGAEHENVVPYNAYATSDGYLVVAIFTEKFWAAFCRAMELEQLIDDPRFATNDQRRGHRDSLNEILSQRFLEKSTDQWMALLQEAQVPANPIHNVAQVLEDPQILARNMRVSVDHPAAGPLELVGKPIKAVGEKSGFAPPPLLGQHTDQVLADLLGCSKEEIAKLIDEAVIK